MKTAWFLGMRVREAMRELGIDIPGPLGGANRVVESDESWFGGKAANRKGKIPPKVPVVALVERDGRVRSFHVPNVTAASLKPIITANVDRAGYLMTDESPVYWWIGREFAGHGAVNHSAESMSAPISGTSIRSKAISASSSAPFTVAISTFRKPICTDTLPSGISSITIGNGSGSTISPAPMPRWSAQKASA